LGWTPTKRDKEEDTNLYGLTFGLCPRVKEEQRFINKTMRSTRIVGYLSNPNFKIHPFSHQKSSASSRITKPNTGIHLWENYKRGQVHVGPSPLLPPQASIKFPYNSSLHQHWSGSSMEFKDK